MSNPFTVHLLSWHNGEPLLRAIREEVFIREQGVPAELEWDDLDQSSKHILALSVNGEAIGCGTSLRMGISVASPCCRLGAASGSAVRSWRPCWIMRTARIISW